MKKKIDKQIDNNKSLKEIVQSGRGNKITIKKSKFIASAYKITKVEEKLDILENIKKEMKKATHNAWVNNFIFYSLLPSELEARKKASR